MEKFTQNTNPESEKKLDHSYKEYEEAVAKTKDFIASSETKEELKQKLTEAGIWFGQINWIGQDNDEYEESKNIWEECEKDGSRELIFDVFQNYRSKSGAFVHVELDPHSHF